MGMNVFSQQTDTSIRCLTEVERALYLQFLPHYLMFTVLAIPPHALIGYHVALVEM